VAWSGGGDTVESSKGSRHRRRRQHIAIGLVAVACAVVGLGWVASRNGNLNIAGTVTTTTTTTWVSPCGWAYTSDDWYCFQNGGPPIVIPDVTVPDVTIVISIDPYSGVPVFCKPATDVNKCDPSKVNGYTLVPGGSFVGANLNPTSGMGCCYGLDLHGADLTNADMRNANLNNTNLSGAKMGGTQLGGAAWWNTTCPNGTKNVGLNPC